MRRSEGAAANGKDVGGSDHDVAVDTIAQRLGLPASTLSEAIAEARSVGRHRVRAVSAQRIDEIVSELADGLPFDGGA